MKNKTASLLSIALTIFLFVFSPVAIVFFVDPFQIYHKTFFEKAGYSQEQMYQHAGWINRILADPQQGYQSIVIGSSVMANYTQSLFDEKLPQWGKTLNLSVNGSVPRMQAVIANDALLKNPSIRNILWDIHYYYVLDLEGDPAFPYYLYNDTVIDDKGYFFNITNLTSSLRFFKGDFSGFVSNVENNGPWYESLLSTGRFDRYKSVEYRKTLLADLQSTQPVVKPDFATIDDFQYSEVEKYLLATIMPLCNDDKEINIMFSPATRYSYAAQQDTNHLLGQLYMRRYILDRTSACKNIKIFAFDNVDWISGDMTNYADNYHYKLKVNAYILESIAQGRHQLSAENIEQYERDFIGAVNEYEARFSAELTDMENSASNAPMAARP